MTHTSTELPEALRLAEHLEKFRSFPDDLAAAAELRRLHAESEQHLQELRSYRITVENREARIAELEAQLAAAQQGVQQDDALQAALDMLHTARQELDLLREALNVQVEPHQSLFERMLEAAQATHPAKQGLDAQKWLQQHDMEALERFAETTGDCEGYDISKDAVRRLAGFGCLQYHGFGKYSITDFGHYVLADWEKARELPFKTQHERDAEFFEAIANQAKSATQAAKQGGAE